MTARVDRFVTYFATCEECRWEGTDHEDNYRAAEIDAEEHDQRRHR